MLAALTIAGISIVTSMQAQALSLRSSEGEHNMPNQNNLCITNNNIGDEPITSNHQRQRRGIQVAPANGFSSIKSNAV